MAFGPTVIAIASKMGDVNCVLLMALIIIAVQAALLTPGASSTAACVHSNTQWTDVKQAYILGIVIILLSVVCLAICYPLGAMIL